MMDTDACPVCGGASTEDFMRRDEVPVHQNLVIADRVQARAAPRGTLAMAVCRECGFVFNRAFDPAKLAYGQDYDNTQSHSAMFDGYLDQLVDQLVHQHGVRGASVVEVGCGKGHFLRKLVEFPGADNRGFGFDPSYVGPQADLAGRLVFRRCFYDASCADVAADFVVCRHVIEHVPDPLLLLRAVRAALGKSPDARVFFETPCVEWILRNQVLWDFFYEHCSLFSQASLRVAFERCGFVVEQVQHVFGGQYLWLEARLSTVPETRPAAVASETSRMAHAYGVGEHLLRRTWLSQLDTLKASGKLALWGAGAKGVTFANLVDPDCSTIDCVVDINPNKQGCFIPGTGHAIVAPAALVQRNVRSIILMNPNYAHENRLLLAAAGCEANLIDWSE